MISTVKNIIYIPCVHFRNIWYLSYKDKLLGLLTQKNPYYKLLCVHLRKFNITYLSYKDKLGGLLKKGGAAGTTAPQHKLDYIYFFYNKCFKTEDNYHMYNYGALYP